MFKLLDLNNFFIYCLPMLKKVQSYETTDGQLFTDKAAALTHELKIELRGLIQSNTRSNGNSNFSTTDVAAFLANNMDKVAQVFTAYRARIGAISRNSKKTLDATKTLV